MSILASGNLLDKRVLKILVVDDEYLHAEMAVNLLSSAGWEATSFESDIDSARNHILEHAPDLVLLDLRFLDDYNAGLDLAKEIREDSQIDPLRKPYFVFVTGYGTEDVVEKLSNFPASSYLTKPVSEAKLADAVGTAVERLCQFRDSQWALSQLERNGFADRRGQFVAVYSQAVVDDDDDRNILRQRAAKNLGVAPGRIVIEYKGVDA
jgi:CheY-like chemotaxis protein